MVGGRNREGGREEGGRKRRVRSVREKVSGEGEREGEKGGRRGEGRGDGGGREGGRGNTEEREEKEGGRTDSTCKKQVLA